MESFKNALNLGMGGCRLANFWACTGRHFDAKSKHENSSKEKGRL